MLTDAVDEIYVFKPMPSSDPNRLIRTYIFFFVKVQKHIDQANTLFHLLVEILRNQ